MKQVDVVVESPQVNISSTPAIAQRRTSLPWRDKLRPWLLSVHLQSGMQIAAGIFVACLFTFVRAISYPQSCVTATLFLVVSVMSSPNNHLGTRVNAAASLVGSIWIGATIAAVVATLSKLPGPGPASTAILAVGGSAAIALLAINRVGSQPPMLWALGMTSCLAFGLVALSTWKWHTISEVWIVTGFIVLTAVIAAAVSVLVAALVMPTLATDKVQELLAEVLQSAGISTSRYAARLFRPTSSQCTQQQQVQQQQARSKDAAAAAATDSVHNMNNDVVNQQQQQEKRGNQQAAAGEEGVPSKAQQAAGAAAPPAGYWYSPGGDFSLHGTALQLQRGDSIYSLGEVGAAFVLDDPMTDEQWLELIKRNSSPNPPPNPNAYVCPMPQAHVGLLRPKLAEIQNLLLSAAVVEPPWLRRSLLSSDDDSSWFDVTSWRKVVTALQLLLTRLSALEAVIEDGESLHENDGWTSSPELLSRLRLVYSQTATSLALMACTVKAFGKAQASAAAARTPADGSFCVMVGTFGASWRLAKEELTDYMKHQAELQWKHMMNAAPGSPVVLPSLTNVRHLMFAWVLSNSIITATEQLERALAAAVCNTPPPALLQRAFGWMFSLSPLLSGRHLFMNWRKVLLVNLPDVMRQGSAGIHHMMSQPLFQAGIKYWIVLMLVYNATLVSMHFNSAIASLTPAFGYVAATLTMSEKVEATVSKVSFWLAGTAVGGVLGFLAMIHPVVATNPYALMVIMVVAAFLVGLLGQTSARVTITLTLMTLSALVLCQYNGVTEGRAEVAAARIVSVVAGVLTAVVVCNLIMPWYTSTWAMQTMCDTYEHSIQILCEMIAKSYQKGADAVAAAEATCPSSRSQTHQPSREAAAAADTAAALAATAAEAFADAERCGTARDPASPAALQSEVAAPLVAVQVSLIRDTVAWRKGVLATPPVVPQLLRALQALLDRLAALQLAYSPPSVTGVVTGRHTLRFGVPVKDKIVHLFELHGLLASAVAAAVQHPESRTHCNAVRVLVKSIEQQRTRIYRQMTDVRRDLLTQAFEQQQQITAAQRQPVTEGSPACQQLRQQMCELFGTADDAVAYLGFQFALLKALDKTAAVAKVVMEDGCRIRNSRRSGLL